MRTLIGCCTRGTIDEFVNTPLYNSMFMEQIGAHRSVNDNVVLITCPDYIGLINTNNTDKLSKFYNKVLDFAISEEYECVILAHDDVSIEDKLLFDKLNTAFGSYDIVGIAGGRDVQLREPALWHMMSDKASWSGAVAHPAGDDCVRMSGNRQYKLQHVTAFGPTPLKCLVLDGLFLAIKLSSVGDKIRFDEQIPSIAHHYDLDFCLTCNRNTLKLTTWPIWVVHNSPGLKSFTDEFNASQEYFLNKWKKEYAE